jgi:hypothetical protein
MPQTTFPQLAGAEHRHTLPPLVLPFGGRCLFEMEVSMLELQEGINLLPHA